MLRVLRAGPCRASFRRLSKEATAAKQSTPPPAADTTAASGGGGRRRSRLRTFLALTGAPIVAVGSALAAYHISDEFRQLVDDGLGPDRIQDLKRRFHSAVGRDAPDNSNGGAPRDDFELARQPDVPLEDLEESAGVPAPAGAGAGAHLPSDVVRSDVFRSYLHVLVQEREDALRDEFNAELDRHIATRLETQLESRARELQAQYDADLVAKKQALDEQFETERQRRLDRMAAIEAQVGQVDRIIHNCEDKLSQSEKAHALTSAAIGLDSALDCAGPVRQDLDMLGRYADDVTVGAVLGALPQGAAATEPIPTLEQIRDRFATVSAACRQAALVPVDSGLLGHLIARIFSALLINRDAYVGGDDDLAKLNRGQYFLAQSELDGAIQELESLDPRGLPSALAADWLALAKKRLALQQAAAVLKLYAYELSQARIQTDDA